ncbi:hypothetical protein N7462_005728 [Penicillium macrosclerotiorum]|uniref:uncharacterized protein n=1 Tax=Penicillium macrosclerotiorum TaxID=303699 RepID=UPI002546C27D|nr:uncharacterized protein N7462_005728 [Penicillium macrosclerotiorum]KAJ5682563.1 hypothetical protein N7462_005728 [Penicillium macrosclerotiorum]
MMVDTWIPGIPGIPVLGDWVHDYPLPTVESHRRGSGKEEDTTASVQPKGGPSHGPPRSISGPDETEIPGVTYCQAMER